MASSRISREKKRLAIGVVGGSTVVIDYGGVRFVTDPTLNPPGDYGALTKVEGPAVSREELGRPDVILLSHDQHGDNFDQEGRDYARDAARIVTGPGAAGRLGEPALGLAPWQTTTVARADGGGTISVEVVPAVHGPLDGTRDAEGHVNCEVVGFVLTSPGLPTTYVSGDNAAIGTVAEVASRHPGIDVAVLFAGAARFPPKEGGRPLTLTSERAADAAILLGLPQVVPAHHQGWSIYSEPLERLVAAFADAGIGDILRVADLGTWTIDQEVSANTGRHPGAPPLAS